MKLVNFIQGSPEWKRWRWGGLGGSDVAAVMGLSPYLTRAELLAEKAVFSERESSFAMRRGTRLEPDARNLYASTRRCHAVPQCVEHEEASWIRASLDGLCRPIDSAAGEHQWAIEIKAPCWQDHDRALAGLLPVHYIPQCQYQLFVTGLPCVDYVSFNNGQRFPQSAWLAVVPVEPDAEFMARMLDECEKFWGDVLKARADRPTSEKAACVKSQGQDRDHRCHWPGCTEQVPPAKWGCSTHWFQLPKPLRAAIWNTYRAGQEVSMSPSVEYLAAAAAVRKWIADHVKAKEWSGHEQEFA